MEIEILPMKEFLLRFKISNLLKLHKPIYHERRETLSIKSLRWKIFEERDNSNAVPKISGSMWGMRALLNRRIWVVVAFVHFNSFPIYFILYFFFKKKNKLLLWFCIFGLCDTGDMIRCYTDLYMIVFIHSFDWWYYTM